MEALIFDVKRFAVHDGPGLRTTVFFKGCPLSCLWCHNPESQADYVETCLVNRKIGDAVSVAEKTIGYFSSVYDLMNSITRDSIYFDESKGGVTFSGGEPLMQSDFLLQILKECKQAGIHTTVDTSGFITFDLLEKIVPYTDLFLFDIKHIDPIKHKLLTGVDNKLILENLTKITDLGCKVWIRIPLIPSCNADDDSINAMIETISKLNRKAIQQINILPFHKLANHKYKTMNVENSLSNISEPTSDQVERWKQKFMKLEIPVFTKG